ncbi:NPS5 [Fusarium coicis]|nr:NPS5 [Fusarium coicis]
MLRARFDKRSAGGQRSQRVTDVVQVSLSYAAAEIDNLEEAFDIAMEAERGLGPLYGSLIPNTLTMDGSLADVR